MPTTDTARPPDVPDDTNPHTAEPPKTTAALVHALRAAGEDHEWYPTTRRMAAAIIADMRTSLRNRCDSILDVGAGDGRVLMMLAETNAHAKLFGIEKSVILQQQQPDLVIPVGTDFIEQDLMSLPVDVLFSNPPYREFEEWIHRIITTANAWLLYLVLPQRWETSTLIQAALDSRSAKAKTIHHDDFVDADRRARAIVHVIRVSFTEREASLSYDNYERQDPFDVWFDANIDTFDKEEPLSEDEQELRALARIHALDTIPDMVAAYTEDYARMEEHYKAIFRLDAALLKELGVSKTSVREGLKKRIQGLKHRYWAGLFDRLDVITARLTTQTKRLFLNRLTGQTAVAFTTANAYAVVLWAIRSANQYFDTQLVALFRALSTHDGVLNYASNQRTWQQDGWRYQAESHSHYALDYRIVLHHYSAIQKTQFGAYEYPGGLHTSCHELIDDLIAVFGNLGFAATDVPSRRRKWHPNHWQDFRRADGRTLFQVKGFLNGNLHFRIDQHAIKAFNVEAGRLLGWLRGKEDVVTELRYTPEEAAGFFGSNQRLGPSATRLLGARSDAPQMTDERRQEG